MAGQVSRGSGGVQLGAMAAPRQQARGEAPTRMWRACCAGGTLLLCVPPLVVIDQRYRAIPPYRRVCEDAMSSPLLHTSPSSPLLPGGWPMQRAREGPPASSTTAVTPTATPRLCR